MAKAKTKKIVIAGFRVPATWLAEFKRAAKKQGLDYGSMIRDAVGAPQPGDESWPTSAPKKER